MLRDYEILYIVRPDLEEEQLNEAVAQVNRLIENLGGNTLKTDVWGRRRLAYEVRHLREGQYVLTDFRIEPARVPEMEATLKISDTVFRHLVVRKPELGGDGAARATAVTAATAATEAPAEPARPGKPAAQPETSDPQQTPAEPAEETVP